MEKLTHYYNILSKNYKITDPKKQEEYMEFCLNNVKDNIIYCHDNTNPTKAVITELFKRSMAKKYNMDNKKNKV